MVEKRWRSIAKVVSWRITATTITMIVSWLITKQIAVALSIGFFEMIAKMIVHYYHERLWNRVKIGLMERPEYQI